MATSPSGLQEVEHLSLPAGLRELRENIVSYRENSFFHRELLLIPGLKTCARGVMVSPEEAFLVNNVRGEETEILGILCETGFAEDVYKRQVSSLPMKISHSIPIKVAAVAVATPCCPAPVSAITRVFPIFFARSTCPSTLFILWAPVWFR